MPDNVIGGSFFPRGTARPTDQCYWMQDDEIGPFHVPGCWGAVAGGPDGCICEFDDPNTLEGRLQNMERKLAELESEIRTLKGESDD